MLKSKKSLSTVAKVKYTNCDFQIVVPGDYVICAITGDTIPINDLKYWNHERQEPYIDAYAAFKASVKGKIKSN